MVKKEGHPKNHKKNKSSRARKNELEEKLIDNFISLQKVLTNLSVKFDDLSRNIDKLLQLFEISAKSFAEKYAGESFERQPDLDQEFLKKLDVLLDQNKTIAKGIMLMEDRIKNKAQGLPDMGMANYGTRIAPRY